MRMTLLLLAPPCAGDVVTAITALLICRTLSSKQTQSVCACGSRTKAGSECVVLKTKVFVSRRLDGKKCFGRSVEKV